MTRALRLALAAGLLAGSAAAQSATLDLTVHRGRLRDAGTFHWSTKTWTRAGSRTFQGAPQTVYENTCFWTGLPANTVAFHGVEPCQDLYDEGRIPATGVAGASEENHVVGLSFGHVTFAPLGSVDVELTFYDHLGGVCVGGTPPTPPQPAFAGQVRLSTANGVTLPGDPTGTGTAWVVTVDLSGGGEFCLVSDGDGTTGNGNDLFTWRFAHDNSVPPFGMNQGGPIVAAEPVWGFFGACTYGMTGSQACGSDPNGVGPCGTGLGANDSYWENLDGNGGPACPQGGASGCFFFGGWPGNPWGSHFLRLVATDDCDVIVDPTPTYCTGKTTSTGCVPFVTASGVLPSASNPGAFLIQGFDHLENQAGLLIYGFKKANLNFHGGKLCVKAPFARTGAKQAKSVSCVDPGGSCTTTSCGLLSRNFNATIQNGNDPLLTVGQSVHAQWRQRDPADPLGFGDNLSNAIQFVIAP